MPREQAQRQGHSGSHTSGQILPMPRMPKESREIRRRNTKQMEQREDKGTKRNMASTTKKHRLHKRNDKQHTNIKIINKGAYPQTQPSQVKVYTRDLFMLKTDG